MLLVRRLSTDLPLPAQASQSWSAYCYAIYWCLLRSGSSYDAGENVLAGKSSPTGINARSSAAGQDPPRRALNQNNSFHISDVSLHFILSGSLRWPPVSLIDNVRALGPGKVSFHGRPSPLRTTSYSRYGLLYATGVWPTGIILPVRCLPRTSRIEGISVVCIHGAPRFRSPRSPLSVLRSSPVTCVSPSQPN